MIAATLLLAALIAWRFAPMAWRQARLLYWQSKCMNYTAPADRVVFRLAENRDYIVEEWFRFYSLWSPPGFMSRATLFLHERLCPNGSRRLIAVGLHIGNHGEMFWKAYVFSRGTAISRPRLCGEHYGSFGRGSDILYDADVIYAGQPDASDASHFTLRLVIAGDERVLDGWLRDNDEVVIEPRTTPPPASNQPAP
jgi:hypothetical protein